MRPRSTRPRAALLQRGRLTEELKAAGFGPLEAVAPPRGRGDEVARAARERVTTLRSEARRLDAEAREAEQAAADASRAAEILADEAAEKRREAERAAAELADAEPTSAGAARREKVSDTFGVRHSKDSAASYLRPVWRATPCAHLM